MSWIYTVCSCGEPYSAPKHLASHRDSHGVWRTVTRSQWHRVTAYRLQLLIYSLYIFVCVCVYQLDVRVMSEELICPLKYIYFTDQSEGFSVCAAYNTKSSDTSCNRLCFFYPFKEMIDEADRDGDGEVNEQEFLRIMKKTNLYWTSAFKVWDHFFFKYSPLEREDTVTVTGYFGGHIFIFLECKYFSNSFIIAQPFFYTARQNKSYFVLMLLSDVLLWIFLARRITYQHADMQCLHITFMFNVI